MDNVKFSSFQNMCRTCMNTSDLILIQGHNIIDVLQFLSGTRYSNTDELPQQLCSKCIGIMNEIQAFACRCKQTHLTLKNCLNDFKINKNLSLNNKTINRNNIEENISEVEFIDIKQEHMDVNNHEYKSRGKLLVEQINGEIKNEDLTNNQNVSQNNKVEFIEIKQEILHDPNEELLSENMVKNELFEIVTKQVIQNEPTITDSSDLNKDNLEKISNEETDTNSNLKQHYGKGPFKCDICSKTCNTKSNLAQHKKMHINRNIRRFECDVCMKGFKYSTHLIEHKRIHSGERPYQCEVCNKRFARKHHMVRHQTKHSKERPFECDLCSKKFKCVQILKDHKLLHSVERLCQCSICNKTFRAKGTLAHHKKVLCNACRMN